MADTDTADFYSRWAPLYDRLATRFPGVAAARRRTAEVLVEPGDTVVEVGCGTGANLPYLRARAGPDGRVIGVDVSPGALSRARERIERAGWGNVGVVRGDGATLPVAGVDAILGSFVAGMFADPATVVSGWRDRAEKVGLLCAARSEREAPWVPPLNAAFGLFVRLANPERLRRSPVSELDESVRAARGALDADVRDSFLGGLVTLSVER